MELNKIQITRAELYNKIWRTPMTTLAKEFGLNNQHLKKLCQDNNIPVPPCGYWTKLQFGKAPKQPRLPEIGEGIEVSLPEKKTIARSKLSNQKPKSKYSADGVWVKKSLRNPHRLITETKNSIDDYCREHTGLIRPRKGLDVATSPKLMNRAFRILNTIVKYFERRGQTTVAEHTGSPVRAYSYILFDKVKIPIKIREKYTTIQNDDKKDYHSLKYIPLGKLIFEVPLYPKHSWIDTENVRIEQRIRHIIETIMKCAIAEEVERQRREEEERLRKIEENRREQERQRQEIERAKCEQLRKDALLWNQCQQIRAYLKAVEEHASEKAGQIENGSEMDLWLKWGLAYADRIDPVRKEIGKSLILNVL